MFVLLNTLFLLKEITNGLLDCWVMADKKTEAIEIKRMGGKAQKNSGRGLHQKGDAITSIFCVDVKEYANSFGLSKKVWAKICTDAMRSGNYEPALKLILGTEKPVRLWIVAEHIIDDYMRLLEKENG